MSAGDFLAGKTTSVRFRDGLQQSRNRRSALKQRASITLLAACLAMAGCRDQDAATASASPDQALPETSPALSMTDAFSIQDDVARLLDVNALFEVDGTMLCSVDSINETAASSPVVVSRSGRARFSGFIEGDSLDQPSVLVLRSDEAAYVVRNVLTKDRSDIASSKGIEDGSAYDYSTFAAMDAVAPGTYFIDLVAKQADAYRRCASSVSVVVQ